MLAVAGALVLLAGCGSSGPHATSTSRKSPCGPAPSSASAADAARPILVSHDDFTGHEEPDVAVDPTNAQHLLAASQADRGPRIRIPVAYSSVDGGQHWRPTLPLPMPAGFVIGADTTVAFTPDGVGYVSATVVGRQGGGFASRVRHGEVLLWRSPDSGRSFARPTVVFDGTTLEDHPWLAAGPDGALSIAWTDQAGLRFAQSHNRGRTFSPARVLIAGPAPLDPVVVTTARGVHVFYETQGPQQLTVRVLRSFDGGGRFTAPVTVGSAVEDQLPGQVAGRKSTTVLPLFGAVAAAHGSAVYVALTQINRGAGPPRILIWSSASDAEQWNPPIVLHDPVTAGLAQSQPRLAIAHDRSLDVLYLATERSGTAHVVLTHVHTGHVTSGARLNTFCVPDEGFVGDYQALATTTTSVIAMWNGQQHNAHDAPLQILTTTVASAP